jgi:TetR/AcrR family transcriptional repressor of bet genes
MGRPPNTEERRAQIVGGLVRVMAERGWEEASTAAIAKAAGLSPGLVHYHFANKLEVLRELVAHVAKVLRARVERRLATEGDDPRERLHAFVDAHVALGDDADAEAVAAWVHVGGVAARIPEVRDVYAAAAEESLAVLTDLVREAGAAGPEEARRVAVTIRATIEGVYLTAMTVPGAIPRGSAAPLLHAAVDALIGHGRGR